MNRNKIVDFNLAIERGDYANVQSMINECPDILNCKISDSKSWLATASGLGHLNIVNLLIDKGCDINSYQKIGTAKSSSLSMAINGLKFETAHFLLKKGANPNLDFDRAIISAVSVSVSSEQRMKMVKMLVEHGADVNRLYDLFGDWDRAFTVLDWTSDPEVKVFLRSQGAKTAAELKAEKGPPPPLPPLPAKSHEPTDEVVSYFETHFGAVDAKSLVEIVPTGHPIAIHVIRPEGNRKHLTLFTTGLSDQPMVTPPEQEDYALAELFIQLPGDWPIGPGSPPDSTWVVHWIRKIAQYPQAHKTWLGGPVTIIDNEDPPQPLGPQVAFTSWLLFAEKSFELKDGKIVQLYRLLPLYREERDLERREGAPALMRALDRAGVPFVVDINRKCAAV